MLHVHWKSKSSLNGRVAKPREALKLIIPQWKCYSQYIFVMVVMTYDIDWNTDIPFIGFRILSLKCSWHFQRRHSHSFKLHCFTDPGFNNWNNCLSWWKCFLLSHVTNYCKLSCCLISCDLISHHSFDENNLNGFSVIFFWGIAGKFFDVYLMWLTLGCETLRVWSQLGPGCDWDIVIVSHEITLCLSSAEWRARPGLSCAELVQGSGWVTSWGRSWSGPPSWPSASHTAPVTAHIRQYKGQVRVRVHFTYSNEKLKFCIKAQDWSLTKMGRKRWLEVWACLECLWRAFSSLFYQPVSR